MRRAPRRALRPWRLPSCGGDGLAGNCGASLRRGAGGCRPWATRARRASARRSTPTRARTLRACWSRGGGTPSPDGLRIALQQARLWGQRRESGRADRRADGPCCVPWESSRGLTVGELQRERATAGERVRGWGQIPVEGVSLPNSLRPAAPHYLAHCARPHTNPKWARFTALACADSALRVRLLAIVA